MYLAVADELRRAGAPMVEALPGEDNTYEHVRPAAGADAALSVHSPATRQILEEHWRRSYPSLQEVDPRQIVRVPLFACGQSYAMTALHGYALRRAERRYRLERTLTGAGGAEASGDGLRNYLEAVAPKEFEESMLTLEAQMATEALVEAHFGDLNGLKAALSQAMQDRGQAAMRDPNQELTKALDNNEVANTCIVCADLRRLVYEAASFGALLVEAEVRAQGLCDLTTATDGRLWNFGVPD
uniref:Uncharacterized protein n=1 Tax=Zooxanthella nutricula TaxID=1333877 RepID=A0A7S2PZP7_9DINO